MMSGRHTWTTFRGTQGILAALCVVGCDPVPPALDDDTVTLEEFSTVPVTQAAGFRVQMEARVTRGLSLVTEAVFGSGADVRVCLGGACVAKPLLAASAGTSCPGTPIVEDEGTQLSVVRASLDGDVVAIAFCVGGLTEQRSFQSVVRRGTRASNVVFTSCLPGPTCQSQ
jgi:hypothetical protein